ncbi:MAG: pseudouridine synthase [Ignavibacteria bacterium]
MESTVRLNKFIASNGISSRRKVDELIEQGRVTVNGNTVIELGFKIDPAHDKVALDGEAIRTDTKKIYVILNKPKGIITSVSDDKHRTTVIDLIKINQKIFPVGRLDYHTSGLLLLTNDGELANKLMSPVSKVYKTYFVQLSKPLEEKHRIKLSEGIKLEGIRTAPAIIRFPKKTDYQSLFISIHEGKNHQVRNMFEHYGYFVRELQRTEYAGMKLGSLRESEWSYLTPEELALLNSIVKDTPANHPKPAHTGKKPFRKIPDKYRVGFDKKDDKKDYKRSDRKEGSPEKKLSYNKKRIEERGVNLGFRKNQDPELKSDPAKNENSEERRDYKSDIKRSDRSDERKSDNRGFKKFDERDDKKFVKKDFKKFDRSDKDTRPGYKKFEKRDDKKFEKKDFKKFDRRDDRKDSKPGYKKFEKRDDKNDVKSGFKKFDRRDDRKDTKPGYKKFEKRDDKPGFKKFGRSDDRKDSKPGFKKFEKRDDKKFEKKDFKKNDNTQTRYSFGKKNKN